MPTKGWGVSFADNDAPTAGASREEKLTATFVDLADTLVETFDVDAFLFMLCTNAQDALNVDAVGVMLESVGGRLQLSTASTDDSAALDLFEIQEEQGPCYDAYRTGEQVVELDLKEGPDRWPGFTAMALERGFYAVYAFPMRLRDDRIGAMNMFRKSRGAFDARDVNVAQALADLATIGLLSQRRIEKAETRAEELQHALHSRVIIEQAKGVVAERHGLSTHEAFDRIRRYARYHRRSIRGICPEIIEGRLDV